MSKGNYTPGPRPKERSSRQGTQFAIWQQIRLRGFGAWELHEIAKNADVPYNSVVHYVRALRDAGAVEMVTAAGWSPTGYPIRATFRATYELDEAPMLKGRDRRARRQEAGNADNP